MTLDPDVSRLFDESNFDAYDKQDNRFPRVLEEALVLKKFDVSQVLAVSHTLSLEVICKDGFFTANEVGRFNRKHVEAYNLIPYTRVTAVQTGPHGRFGTKVEISLQDATRPITLEYGTGGDVGPEHAAAEANRIARIISRQISA